MKYSFGYINTIEEFDTIVSENDAVFVYFNSSSCNVGEALAPKVMKMIDRHFPKIKFYYVDMEISPEIPAQYSVFVEPTVLCFFAGKESLRKSRHFSMDELEHAISRPYSLIFD